MSASTTGGFRGLSTIILNSYSRSMTNPFEYITKKVTLEGVASLKRLDTVIRPASLILMRDESFSYLLSVLFLPIYRKDKGSTDEQF